MLERWLLLKKIPVSSSFGLLILRVSVYGILFLKHGAEKIFTFRQVLPHFKDPIHIGPLPSLIIAMISDGICSLLVILGLGTRWAVAFQFCNLFVAWAFVDHFGLLQKGLQAGEPKLLYMACCLALFFAGAGRYSLDALIEKRSTAKKQYEQRNKLRTTQ